MFTTTHNEFSDDYFEAMSTEAEFFDDDSWDVFITFLFGA